MLITVICMELYSTSLTHPTQKKNQQSIIFSYLEVITLSFSFLLYLLFLFYVHIVYFLFYLFIIFMKTILIFSCSDVFPVPSFIDSPVSGQMGFVFL